MKNNSLLSILLLTFTAIIFLTACEKNEVGSDQEFYQALQEPLTQTIMNEGNTLEADGGGQLFEYKFAGHITDTFSITMGRRIHFNDCSGCTGDWVTGIFSPPAYRDEFISLREFVVQMINSNSNEELKDFSGKIWRTDKYLWMLTYPNKQKFWKIKVYALSPNIANNWEIYFREDNSWE